MEGLFSISPNKLTVQGLALSSIGEYKKAEEAHLKSLQLDKNFLEAWAHLTQVSIHPYPYCTDSLIILKKWMYTSNMLTCILEFCVISTHIWFHYFHPCCFCLPVIQFTFHLTWIICFISDQFTCTFFFYSIIGLFIW